MARCCTALSTTQGSFCLIFMYISSNTYAVISFAQLLLSVGKYHFWLVIACRVVQSRFLGKSQQSKGLEGCLQTKELDGMVEEVQGIGRKVIYLVCFSEVGVSMALAACSLKCQVIDASSSGSTNVNPPPSILAEAVSPAVALAEQHEQEVDNSDNILPWSTMEESP